MLFVKPFILTFLSVLGAIRIDKPIELSCAQQNCVHNEFMDPVCRNQVLMT